MKSLQKSQQRARRSDGDATRSHIFEIAGQLFAEKGYAQATSKEICEHAKCNIAAINYYFGNRDELYKALLKEAHNHYLNADSLNKLLQSNLTPKEKISQITENIASRLLAQQSWHARLLMREILDPSPITHMAPRPHIGILNKVVGLFSEFSGSSATDPKVVLSVLTFIAPAILMLLVKSDSNRPLQSLISCTPEDLANHMKKIIFIGLENTSADDQASKLQQ